MKYLLVIYQIIGGLLGLISIISTLIIMPSIFNEIISLSLVHLLLFLITFLSGIFLFKENNLAVRFINCSLIFQIFGWAYGGLLYEFRSGPFVGLIFSKFGIVFKFSIYNLISSFEINTKDQNFLSINIFYIIFLIFFNLNKNKFFINDRLKAQNNTVPQN